MKYKILFFSFLLLLNILNNKVLAVSAYPYPIIIKQPDNTELTIRLVGDEFFHYIQTIDGLLIQQNDNGIFEYAELNNNSELKLSGIKVKDITKRNEKEIEYIKQLKEKRIKENWLNTQQKKSQIQIEENTSQSTLISSAPVTGTKKILCILIGYQDRAFSKTQGAFNNLMNQSGYNGTGSIKDFYSENSYGKLNLEVTVVGSYTADYNMAYYGANNYNSGGERIGDVNPQALIIEALQKANPNVNYADFDNDGDGKVDGVHVIFAGYDEAAGGSTNAIWSHRWSIAGITLDGKLIKDYSCSSELRNVSGNNICGIGTACHEMGHVFGASDFYDTNYEDNGEYEGSGSWDLMASGNWNSGTDKPAHFNPYTKTKTFQWATTQDITSNQQITLYPANSNANSFYRINTFTPNEYFLIENRQKLGFDAGLTGDGLLVYHVHSLFNGSSQTNNITHPQRFYPICASAMQNPNTDPASYGNINSTGCPFPGSSNKFSLTQQTIPSFISWAGIGTGFDIQSISKNGNNININVKTYYSISGLYTICDQTTYTIDNLTAGTTVSWTYSTNLQSVYGGSNFIVIKAKANGSAWIDATVNSSYGTITLPRFNLIAGYPTPTLLVSQHSGEGEPLEVLFRANPYVAGAPNTYHWYVNNILEESNFDDNEFIRYVPCNQTLNVKCKLSNICGTSGFSSTAVVSGDCSSPKILTVNPNPASETLDVNIASASASDTTHSTLLLSPLTDTEEETELYFVTIANYMGTVVFSSTYPDPHFIIPVSQINQGSYILSVTEGANKYQKTVVIKH